MTDANTGVNPLFDPTTDNQAIPQDMQSRLNAPLAGGVLSDEDRAFADQIHALVENGTIDLYSPSSLLNQAVYAGLSDVAKGKADYNAVTMLGKIRDIVALDKAAFDTNIQVGNLIHALRLTKENLEMLGGDIFVI